MVTVALQAQDVRAAIHQAAGGQSGPAAGSLSSILLGQIFHEVFASLIGPDARLNFHAVIDEAEPELDEWQRALIKHTYQNLVGPAVRQHQAMLHHISDQVLTFWDAVQEMCKWLAERLWWLRESGDRDLTLADSFLSEQQQEIREPEWTEAVLLTNRAGAAWRIPGTRSWCLVELRIAPPAPEADLMQACLHDQLLSETEDGVVLVSFDPLPQEHAFPPSELELARPALRSLIGTLAGVLPKSESEPRPSHDSTAIKPEHGVLGRQLIDALLEYGVEIQLDGDLLMGPAFLRFPVGLGSRARVRLIEQLAQEIQGRLRLETPPRIGVEGGQIVIDLQRPDRQPVYFSEISTQLPRIDPWLGNARAPVGIDLSGRLRMIDFTLPEDAHLLVAGATGSGKSEWLRAAMAGLILTNTPETLRLLIIDDRQGTFRTLGESPFLYGPPVAPDEQPVAEVLAGLADEVDRRYLLLIEHGADSLAAYLRQTSQPLPRIFCVCDEYTDLIAADKPTRRAIEQQIGRFGQRARAAGIHLIRATRHPSRQTIKGVLDSNLPARVGLKMQKAIESKILLNGAGAETLLGDGDLLFKDLGEPIRLQGPRLLPEEAARIFGR